MVTRVNDASFSDVFGRRYFALPVDGRLNNPAADQLPHLSQQAYENSMRTYMQRTEVGSTILNKAEELGTQTAHLSVHQKNSLIRHMADYTTLKGLGVVPQDSTLEVHSPLPHKPPSKQTMMAIGDKRIAINPAAPDFDSFSQKKDFGKRLPGGTLIHESIHLNGSRRMSIPAFLEPQAHETYAKYNYRIGSQKKASPRFNHAVQTVKTSLAKQYQAETEDILELTSKRLGVPRHKLNSQVSKLLSPYWEKNPSEFLTTLSEATMNLKLQNTTPTPGMIETLGQHNSSGVNKLIKASTTPFTDKERKLLTVMVDEATKALPTFKEALQSIEHNWSKVAPTLLHWASRP